jgi:hypothetical protein
MYLGELSPKNLRGALGVIPQLFITIGILVAQVFGLRNLLANDEGESRTVPVPALCAPQDGRFPVGWLSLGPQFRLEFTMLVSQHMVTDSP